MKEFIKGNEEGVYRLTNHQVGLLQQTEGFNQNHLAKVLIGHIDNYKHIIDNLL